MKLEETEHRHVKRLYFPPYIPPFRGISLSLILFLHERPEWQTKLHKLSRIWMNEKWNRKTKDIKDDYSQKQQKKKRKRNGNKDGRGCSNTYTKHYTKIIIHTRWKKTGYTRPESYLFIHLFFIIQNKIRHQHHHVPPLPPPQSLTERIFTKHINPPVKWHT